MAATALLLSALALLLAGAKGRCARPQAVCGRNSPLVKQENVNEIVRSQQPHMLSPSPRAFHAAAQGAHHPVANTSFLVSLGGGWKRVKEGGRGEGEPRVPRERKREREKRRGLCTW